MSLIPRFDSSSSPTDVAAAVTSVGAAIIERLVPTDMVDDLLAEMSPHIDSTPNGADDFSGRLTKRTGELLTRSKASQQFIAHPLVLGCVDRVLGPNATNYQLHLTQIISIGPGGRSDPMTGHAENLNPSPSPRQ